MKVLIFNPEADFARGAGYRSYTPPTPVVALAREMALTMLPMAEEGDYILVPDDYTPDSRSKETMCRQRVKTITLSQLGKAAASESHGNMQIIPWGWTHQLRRTLQAHGIAPESMPSDTELNDIRRLSHRRITIPLSERISPDFIPLEFDTADEAMQWWGSHPEAYFKAPWSSSGRGVLRATGLDSSRVEPWIRGTIKRQGSVIAEKEDIRRLDFATEWIVEDGVVNFFGLSVFRVSFRGKYSDNVSDSFTHLYGIISNAIGETQLEQIIKFQRKALQEIIAPYYSGPLGIDMYQCEDGNVRGCVELNLRYTMGHMAIYRYLRIK